MLVGLLALCLLLPATGSASSGSKPRSADAAVTHAKKKRKKKRRHARCKHYRKLRVKRGHRSVTVRRCVHKKKKQSSNQQVVSGAPTAVPPVAAACAVIFRIPDFSKSTRARRNFSTCISV